MGRQIHRQLQRALGLIAPLAFLVLIIAGCDGEDGDADKASPVIDEATSAEQEPVAEETDAVRDRGDSFGDQSTAVLAEIDEKGGGEEYVNYLALQEIDLFWAQQFATWADSQQYTSEEGGSSYASARLVIPAKPVKMGDRCGVASEEDMAFYCKTNNTVYFLPKTQTKMAEEYGPFSLAYAVAHEWGHHVQGQLGYLAEYEGSDDSDSRALENHADCLTGVWARSYYERGHLDRRAILEGINVAYATGQDQSQDGRGTGWGTSEERVRWFLTGYTSGNFSECSGALQ